MTKSSLYHELIIEFGRRLSLVDTIGSLTASGRHQENWSLSSTCQRMANSGKIWQEKKNLNHLGHVFGDPKPPFSGFAFCSWLCFWIHMLVRDCSNRSFSAWSCNAMRQSVLVAWLNPGGDFWVVKVSSAVGDHGGLISWNEQIWCAYKLWYNMYVLSQYTIYYIYIYKSNYMSFAILKKIWQVHKPRFGYK